MRGLLASPSEIEVALLRGLLASPSDIEVALVRVSAPPCAPEDELVVGGHCCCLGLVNVNPQP